MIKAKVSDIFYSVQGEGIYSGSPQVFVRFYGCRLNCAFCDTRLNAFDKYTPLGLWRRLKAYTQDYHSLCLTGGEPLLEKKFLKQFLPLAKYDGKIIYLETNGIEVAALKELIEQIDIIAMDIKLPSSTRMRPFWQEHRRFLRAALGKEVFVKMVVCLRTTREDIAQAVKLLVEAGAKDIPLILQPNYFELNKELQAKLRALRYYCLRSLKQVRVVPQLHRLMGVK